MRLGGARDLVPGAGHEQRQPAFQRIGAGGVQRCGQCGRLLAKACPVRREQRVTQGLPAALLEALLAAFLVDLDTKRNQRVQGRLSPPTRRPRRAQVCQRSTQRPARAKQAHEQGVAVLGQVAHHHEPRAQKANRLSRSIMLVAHLPRLVSECGHDLLCIVEDVRTLPQERGGPGQALVVDDVAHDEHGPTQALHLGSL